VIASRPLTTLLHVAATRRSRAGMAARYRQRRTGPRTVRGVRLQDGHTGGLIVSLIEAVRELATRITALDATRDTQEE
jgi:hypothetical protein